MFDEDIRKVKFQDGDVFLVNDTELFKELELRYKTFLVKYDLCDEDDSLQFSVNNFFEQLPNEVHFLKNKIFSRVFRPLTSIISQIEFIIAENIITEIMLFGGNNYQYLALSGGEGEGEKFLYKSSWFLNHYLNTYFKKSIKVIWIKSSIFNKYIHIIRENKIFIKIIFKLLSSLVSRRNKKVACFLKQREENTFFITVVSAFLQYEQLKKILNNINDSKKVFLTSSFSKLSKNHKIQNLLKYDSVGIRSFFYSLSKYYSTAKFIRNKNIEYQINGKKIRFDPKAFCLAIKTNFLIDYSHIHELKRILVSGNNRTVYKLVSAYTIEDEIVVINKVCEYIGIKNYNFQIVSMAKVLIPQLKLAFRFYLYSERTFKLYKKHSDSFRYYLPIFNNSVDKNSEFIEKKYALSIFTQPNEYTEQYLRFCDELFELIKCENLNSLILIKPHYREQKFLKFKEYEKKYTFIKVADKSLTPNVILNNSTFMISMTSAVLFESIILGCPGIVADLNKNYQKFIYDNDVCFPEVNLTIKNVNEVMDILKNPLEFHKKYIINRTLWLTSNRTMKLDDVTNELLM